MPSVSEKQHRAMEAAAHGHSTLGIPKSVGEEFVAKDESLKGASEEEISKHIGDLIDRGYEREQAVAIAYKEAGKSRSDANELTDERTELDIAKAIRDGELESPQRIGDLWLFDVRITGTGVSYRPKHEEYVYRPPEFYLTDEFLARCSGLPVIFDHPEKKGQIDTDEWRQRAIGSIVLPYIPNETTERKDPTEVWGIARIHDGDAAELMMTSHISTSPAVKFGAAGSTKTVRMDDGSRLMIEGNPNYIDHLAVCPEGVWDKGGEPRGVNTGT